ncbi:UNVERIFIED_CONTAM: putative acyl-activating enzyme 2 [Sesamum angustifolium]|uniref:Acyl-activating enzyme 2 n=1 Tax=Sesamum angustifolium TaxID=2727405 RepID=A0AAW2LLA3_9LAMI
MSHLFRRRTPINRRRFFNGVKKVDYPSQNSRRFCELPENPEVFSWKSMKGLVRCPANYAPLSPISFLERAAKVYRDGTSVVYGSLKFTWKETFVRCVKLASALAQLGISRGDVVATLAPNVPAMQELHFAVPMAGAVLCTLNTRHDSTMISVLLQHSEAKIIFVDHQLLHVAQGASDLLAEKNIKPPILVQIPEPNTTLPPGSVSNTYEYENFLAGGDVEFVLRRPRTEWDPISINYTSGTTSRPKGCPDVPLQWVVLDMGLGSFGGTNVCLRHVSPKEIFDNIVLNQVTHMGGAPTVLNMIVNSSDRRILPHKVDIMTGGAPPPPSILSKIEELGFRVSHLYGLTETYGPGTSCVWKPEWDSLPREEQLRLKARQGVEHYGLEEVDATKEAFAGGWFRSGDLAVKHKDGYIEVKDRLKDIVISGGENISTVEVETVLYRHPAILEAGVVARPDNHWGRHLVHL